MNGSAAFSEPIAHGPRVRGRCSGICHGPNAFSTGRSFRFWKEANRSKELGHKAKRHPGRGSGSRAAKNGPLPLGRRTRGETLASIAAGSRFTGASDVARSISLLMLLFFFFFAKGAPAAGLNLAWDPVASPGLAGYMLYYGPAAGNYPSKIDVGNTTGYTVSTLSKARPITLQLRRMTSHTESPFPTTSLVLYPTANQSPVYGEHDWAWHRWRLTSWNASTGSVTATLNLWRWRHQHRRQSHPLHAAAASIQ